MDICSLAGHHIVPASQNLLHIGCASWFSHSGLLKVGYCYIPANTLHNHAIVSIHFNHFYCMGICDKLSSLLSMLTYIYLNVDEC